jgi:hypothetical protein
MAGSPMRALQAGVRQIGEAYFSGAEQPYEKLYMCIYNNYCTTIHIKDKVQFDAAVTNLKAGGGTNFYEAFMGIKDIVTTD